jgi:sugar lactone lactonase YvrE
MMEARTLLTGLVIGESPRWHDGRLWFAHWGAEEIVAVDLEGNAEVMAKGPPGLGWSIDWLPDGRLLVTGEGLRRMEPDGSMVPHADLSHIGDHFNEIVVDGRGNVYVNGGIEFHPDTGSAPGYIAVVTPDGSARRVAEDIAFPNGMVVTPDNSTLIVGESFAQRLTAFAIGSDGSLSHQRVWAELENVTPDGICLDAEGAVWVASPMGKEVVRVRQGGEVVDRIPFERGVYACMLGGRDRKTLHVCTSEHMRPEACEKAPSGRIETVKVAVAGAGLP